MSEANVVKANFMEIEAIKKQIAELKKMIFQENGHTYPLVEKVTALEQKFSELQKNIEYENNVEAIDILEDGSLRGNIKALEQKLKDVATHIHENKAGLNYTIKLHNNLNEVKAVLRDIYRILKDGIEKRQDTWERLSTWFCKNYQSIENYTQLGSEDPNKSVPKSTSFLKVDMELMDDNASTELKEQEQSEDDIEIIMNRIEEFIAVEDAEIIKKIIFQENGHTYPLVEKVTALEHTIGAMGNSNIMRDHKIEEIEQKVEQCVTAPELEGNLQALTEKQIELEQKIESLEKNNLEAVRKWTEISVNTEIHKIISEHSKDLGELRAVLRDVYKLIETLSSRFVFPENQDISDQFYDLLIKVRNNLGSEDPLLVEKNCKTCRFETPDNQECDKGCFINSLGEPTLWQPKEHQSRKKKLYGIQMRYLPLLVKVQKETEKKLREAFLAELNAIEYTDNHGYVDLDYLTFQKLRERLKKEVERLQ